MKITRNDLRRLISEEVETQSSELDMDLSLPPQGEDPEWDKLELDLTRKLDKQPSIKSSAKTPMLALAYHAYKAGSGRPGVYKKGEF